MLCYGASADALNEYLRIGESTALLYLDKFVNAVIVTFEKEFLVWSER
jgi:hypothetical protein